MYVFKHGTLTSSYEILVYNSLEMPTTFVFIELTLKCVMNDKYNELSEQSEVRKSMLVLNLT